MLLSLQFSGLQIVFSVIQHSLLQLLLGPSVSSGKVRGCKVGGWGEADRLCGFVFFLAMVAAGPQLPHFCILSLPPSLVSASICAYYSGRNACSTSLFLGATESVYDNLVPPLSQDPQRALSSGCVNETCLCSSPFPPPLSAPILPSLDVSMHWSQVCLCVEQEIFVE